MPKYTIKAIEQREVYCLVEAESADEARKKAFKKDLLEAWDGNYIGSNDESEWEVKLGE